MFTTNVTYHKQEFSVTDQDITDALNDYMQYRLACEEASSAKTTTDVPHRPTHEFCPLNRVVSKALRSCEVLLGWHALYFTFSTATQDVKIQQDTPKRLRDIMRQWDKTHEMQPFTFALHVPSLCETL
jgi:hypothetical protein